MEIITDDGVIIEQTSGVPAVIDTTMASALARAEIDTQIATAKQYPRSIKAVVNNILSLATLDEETATECIYALRRGGKPIRGPSIRLAEVIASQWGNCRDAAMVVSIDRQNKIITAEGAFHDLETNRGTRASVQRRISDKNGRLFSDDMITVTGNAACSIARRNAILAGVPKGVWRKAVEACEKIIRGDAMTLVERRDGAIKALAHFNLSAEQIFKIMDVNGIEDLSLDDVATLRVIYVSLKNGEQTVEELLRQIEPDKPARVTAATATTSAPAVFANAGVPTADKPKTESSIAEAGKAKDGAVAPAPAVTTPASASQPAATPEAADDDDDSGLLEAFRDTLANAGNAKLANAIWVKFEMNMLPQISAATAAKAKAIHAEAIARLMASVKQQAAE